MSRHRFVAVTLLALATLVPSGAPAEQAQRFRIGVLNTALAVFAINKGTAGAIGVTVPDELLKRADRIVE